MVRRKRRSSSRSPARRSHIRRHRKLKLLPIFDPVFNLREACKHMILLEDHLFNQRKRCHDCIRKHFLTIEGFLDEALTLDKYNKFGTEINDAIKKMNQAVKYYINSKCNCPVKVGQKVRSVRKPLTKLVFAHIN